MADKKTLKNQNAVKLGHLGGLVGGPARTKALSPKERHDIAVKGGKARHKGGK